MRKSLLRLALSPAGFVAAAVGLTGCQSTPTTARPGGLPDDPARRSEAVPRVNASTYFAHGHLIERQGDLKGAVEQYRKALEASPKFVTARNRLGMVLNALGQHAEATAEYRRAAADNPNHAHLQNNLGFSLYLEGDYDGAEKALRRSLELNPRFRRARMNLALTLCRLGRDADALAEFSQVVPTADAHYNLATLQAADGRFAAAVLSLEAALRANPEFEAARLKLREVARLAAEAEAPVAAAPTALVGSERVAATTPAPTDSAALGDASSSSASGAKLAAPYRPGHWIAATQEEASTGVVEAADAPRDASVIQDTPGAAWEEVAVAPAKAATEPIALAEVEGALLTGVRDAPAAKEPVAAADVPASDPCEREFDAPADAAAESLLDPRLLETVDWRRELAVDAEADCGASNASVEPPGTLAAPEFDLAEWFEFAFLDDDAAPRFPEAPSLKAGLLPDDSDELPLFDGLARITDFGRGASAALAANAKSTVPIPFPPDVLAQSAIADAWELAADVATIEAAAQSAAIDAETQALLADLAAAAIGELSEWWDELMCEIDRRFR